jgi:hypothetical protein
VDLGSGSGVVLTLAAELGAKAIGYELNPVLVLYSRLRLARYKRDTKVILGNYWRQNLPADTTVVYVFAVTRDAAKLNRYLTEQAAKIDAKTLRVAAFGFSIPNKKPIKRRDGINLYHF